MEPTPTSIPTTPCENCAQLMASNERLEKRIAELEARLDKNSSNSNRPPSSDPPFDKQSNTKTPSGRKPGGQPGHPWNRRPLFSEDLVTSRQVLLPLTCGECGHPLDKKKNKKDKVRLHQVVEIPPMKAQVTQYERQSRCCDSCGKVTWGTLPEEVKGNFGPKLTALVAYLSGRQHLSKRNIQEMLQSLMGVKISLGSVCRQEAQVSESLKKAWDEAKEVVQKSKVKNADETGWFLSGKLNWLWAATSRKATVFQVHEHRTQEAMKSLLGEESQGIVGSDRFGAYTPIPLEQRQLCWSHLIRDLKGLVDEGTKEGIQTGKAGLKVSQDLFHHWGRFQEGKMGRPCLRGHMNRLEKRLERILMQGRGGTEKKTARFCRRVLKLNKAYWTFARAKGVEPTNNSAERAVRPAVLWRKGSYGNRSEAGCRFTERILTVVETLKLQKRNILDYLSEAVKASWFHQPCPALVK